MDFRAYEATPGISVIVLPDPPVYTHVAVSNDFIRASGMKREDVIGKGHFEVFPKSPDDPNFTGEQNLKASFEYILQHKEPHEIPCQRYDIPNGDGTFCQKYWKINNAPILDDSGAVQYIVHSAVDITDQVEAEQKVESVRGIEAAYNLFMQAPVIIGIVKGKDYIIEMANDAMLQIWGRTKEVIGKPLLEAIPELEGQGYIELLDKVRTTGEPYYAYESPGTLIRNGKEEVLYFDFIYQPYYENPTDTIATGVINVAHDVTEKVLARKKIKESEEKYRTLFDSMDQGFCVIELIFNSNKEPVDYRFLEINPVFEKQTGIKDAVGKTMRELVPNAEPHWFKIYGKVALTGEPIRFIEESVAMGRWFDVYAFRISNANSRKVALLFTDITERKKAEEELRQSEERLQKVLSIETVGVIYFDLDGGIHDANPAFERMSGVSRENLTSGKVRWDELTPPEFMEATLKSRDEFLTKWQNTPYEKQYIRPDGSRWWGLFAGKRLSEKECVEFVLDITETKEVEAELERKVKERTLELEMRNQELEQFAHVSHHDLQEPIRKIIMFAEMVKSDSHDRLTEASQKRFDRITDAAHRMSKALNDILNFASLNKEEQFTCIDLDEILAAVQTDLELVITEKKARITSDALPTIKAVPGQMHQLFYNLVNNALKFSKSGESPLISIRCRSLSNSEIREHLELDHSKQYYEIVVKDNGIGFNQEAADRIFGMFQRLHSKEAYSGTGIGLALCKKVVLNHGGKIWAESKEGEGATFKILLPAE
ncbi:MAG: PAS domain S-box protein [Flavisolibacter sp.]|nr:PAS domain S-box protein [Flavisolibacter sp.]